MKKFLSHHAGLGRRSFLRGQIHPAFKGEVVSDVAGRSEGVRVKHRVNGNSVKMYDKQGSVLRVETTINDARDLHVFRTKEGDPKGKAQYRPLRKGVADLRRRAQLCQSANRRYFDALAAADSSTPLKEFTDALSRPAELNGRRRRALNPLGPDASLLAVVSRAEFLVKGFRNADVRTALLGPDPQDDASERRRRSARVSRLLTLLRAHGLVKKIPHTQATCEIGGSFAVRRRILIILKSCPNSAIKSSPGCSLHGWSTTIHGQWAQRSLGYSL